MILRAEVEKSAKEIARKPVYHPLAGYRPRPRLCGVDDTVQRVHRHTEDRGDHHQFRLGLADADVSEPPLQPRGERGSAKPIIDQKLHLQRLQRFGSRRQHGHRENDGEGVTLLARVPQQ